MNPPQASGAGFTPVTRANTNLPQPAPNLPQGTSQPALIPAPPVRRAGSRGQVHTNSFTAATCSKCAAIVIAGQIHGLRLNLEPTTLNDLTEYQAIRDGIPTYDLWPDLTARRRHLEEIKWPERVPRHARHTCGTTYGTDPRPQPPAQPVITDDTPPF